MEKHRDEFFKDINYTKKDLIEVWILGVISLIAASLMIYIAFCWNDELADKYKASQNAS